MYLRLWRTLTLTLILIPTPTLTPTLALLEGGLIYETMVKSGDICNASAPLYTTLFLEAGIDVMVYSSTMDPLLGRFHP